MKEFDSLKQMGRVQAPEDFEQRVMTLLSEKKKKKEKARVFRLSLAGAATALGVILLVFNLFLFHGKKSPEFAEKGPINTQDQGSYYQLGQGNRIPITEAVDYSGEIREETKQPRTVYILEQVSDSTDTHIKY